MTDPRLRAATDLEAEANRLYRMSDELLIQSQHVRRKAQRLRDEVAAERELDSIREHVGSDVRARKQRRAA